MTHYQALLLDTPRMPLQTPCFLNPATLLPNPEKDRPLHDCSEILAEALAAQKDLTDVSLNNSELVCFTDESSYVKDGQRKAGAAIVNDSGQTRWAETLPPNTSAQKAKWIALIQSLEQAKGKRVRYLQTADMLLALSIFKVRYTRKGDLEQLREKKSEFA